MKIIRKIICIYTYTILNYLTGVTCLLQSYNRLMKQDVPPHTIFLNDAVIFLCIIVVVYYLYTISHYEKEKWIYYVYAHSTYKY